MAVNEFKKLEEKKNQQEMKPRGQEILYGKIALLLIDVLHLIN